MIFFLKGTAFVNIMYQKVMKLIKIKYLKLIASPNLIILSVNI